MEAEKAAAVFTDPPYNVKIDGHVSGIGRITHREFAMASGEMTDEEFAEFLSADHEADLRPHHPGCAYLRLHRLASHGRDACCRPLRRMRTPQSLCLGKINGGMGSLYRSRHELIFVFREWQACPSK